jgi:hypothetical protein
LESKQKAVEESYQAADKRVAQAEEADKQERVAAESTRAKRQQLEAQWEQALQSVNFSKESFLEAQVTPAEQEKWKNAIANYERKNVQL